MGVLIMAFKYTEEQLNKLDIDCSDGSIKYKNATDDGAADSFQQKPLWPFQ